MRSTLILDDLLFAQARQRAAALHTTLSEVVNEALRTALARPIDQAPPFAMITFGGASTVHHEPADLAAALEADEVASLRPPVQGRRSRAR